MTRHELKDGKWYLIRNSKNDYSVDMKLKGFEFNEAHGICPSTEWVEIDPELAFKLFDKPDEWMEKISGVSSNAK